MAATNLILPPQQTALNRGFIRIEKGTISVSELELIAPEREDLWRLARPRLGYKTGVLFVPNRELSERTILTHMVYMDEFSAFRGVIRALGKYGIRRSDSGELACLVGQRTRLDHCLFLLRSWDRDRDASVAFSQQIGTLYRVMRSVRNRHKQTAFKRFLRGGQLRDKRNRKNPGAQRAALAAAIDHLRKREGQIPYVANALDRRAMWLGALLDDGMARYRALLEATQPTVDMRKPNQLVNWLSPHHGQEGMMRTIHLLRGLELLMEDCTRRRPFQKNALYTIRDIRLAVKYAQGARRGALRAAIDRLRNAAQWMFVAHALHGAVLHLGLLLDRDEIFPGPFQPVTDEALRILAMVQDTADSDFSERFKGDLLGHVRSSIDLLGHRKYAYAKGSLKRALSLL